MTNYVLSTERMRVAVKNERGTVIKRKVFRRGDVVTPEDLQHLEGRFDSLVTLGALVDEDADIETYDTAHPAVNGLGVGNSVGGTTPNVDLGFNAEGGNLPEGMVRNDDGSITIAPALAEQLLAAREAEDAEGDEEPVDDGSGSEDPKTGSDDGIQTTEEDEFDASKVEDFSTMDYPTLQRLAKARTGNGAGGKDDLVSRLEAHATENR